MSPMLDGESGKAQAVHLPNHAYVGAALLHVLVKAGGEAPRQQLYKPTATSLGLSAPQLSKVTAGGKNAWTVTINFTRLYLANAGLVKSKPGGIWALTPAGEQAAASTDVLSAVKAAYKAYKKSKPKKGSVMPVVVSVDDGVPHRHANGSANGPSLAELARSTVAPEAFEAAVAESFRSLGLDASHIGGAGDTDVLVRADLASSPYSAVIDAKTTTHLKVGSQIKPFHINNHKTQHAADYAAVVASDFHGGLIIAEASQYGLTLIKAETIDTVLAWHRLVPFSQEELRGLFVGGSSGAPDLEPLRLLFDRRVSQAGLLRAVVNAAADYLGETSEPFSPDAVHATIVAKLADYGLEAKPTSAQVVDAMALLAHPLVGVFSSDGSTGDFRLEMKANTAWARLAALVVEPGRDEADLR